MKKVTKTNQIPKDSELRHAVAQFDYCDSFTINTQTSEDVRDTTIKLFDIPKWIKALTNLRDILVKPFGLRTGDDMNGKNDLPFAELASYPNEILMYEKDSHLTFWVSVRKQNGILQLTTVVKFNNRLGRLYFLPVKPFHVLIVKSILRKFD